MPTKVPKPVRFAQRYWRRYVQFWYWMFATQWRIQTHRVYPFTMAPNWFVRLVTLRLHALAHKRSDVVEQVYQFARREWRIRVERRNRNRS